MGHRRSPALLVLTVGFALLQLGCTDGDMPTDPVPGVGPTVLGLAPTPVEAGGPMTVRGVNLGGSTGGVETSVAGVEADVTAARHDRLRVAVPPPSRYPCRSTREVTTTVSVQGRSDTVRHPFAAASRRALEPGEAALLHSAETLGCLELAADSARYLVTAFNARPDSGAAASFRLLGGEQVRADGSAARPARPSSRKRQSSDGHGSPTAATAGEHAAGTASAREGSPRITRADLRAMRRKSRAHRRFLNRNLRRARHLSAAFRPGGGADRRPDRAAASGGLQEGETTTVRVPDLRAGDLCSQYREVKARVVRVSERAVILVDTDYSDFLASVLEPFFDRAAREFDETQFPILRENFGDPLALDARLDDNGRILMLFSPAVNFTGGAFAFVFPGDLFPRSACASSSEAEIFYGQVPLDADGVPTWRRLMRGTIIHEAKHITSLAERLSRDAEVFPALWLEEATARTAEELWGREVYGYRQFGNTGYRRSVGCEVRPGTPGCQDSPVVMLNHFFSLYFYYRRVETLTPLGPVDRGDFTFYGSGWSLVRYAVDHADRSEASFLRGLTQATAVNGAENLASRFGRPWEELLAGWASSLAADDHPDIQARDPVTQQPSWDIRDVFRKLNRDFGLFFFRLARPLGVHEVRERSFERRVGRLLPGTAAVFRVRPVATRSRLLRLLSIGEERPSDGVGLSVVRVR